MVQSFVALVAPIWKQLPWRWRNNLIPAQADKDAAKPNAGKNKLQKRSEGLTKIVQAYGLTSETTSVYIHEYERYKYQRGSEAIIGEIA
jgi:hypothetical protein